MHKLYISITSLLLLCLSAGAHAQEDSSGIIRNVEEALKAGSSKELVQHLHTKVEIKLDDKKNTHNISRAEAIFKQFFQRHVVTGFRFIHKGNNNSGGIIYAIGSYTSSSGKHRVVVRAKQFNGVYKVYRIEFTKGGL